MSNAKCLRLLMMSGCLCLLTAGSTWAQDADTTVKTDYRVSETQESVSTDTQAPAAGNSQEVQPQRLARIDYISGKVTWRAKDGAAWEKAKNNLPIGPDAQIWANDGARAEIRFDDGSLLRIGNGAVVTLQTLFADDKGKFTQIKLTSGLATLHLEHEHSVFQVDTPIVSVKTNGPARVRIGAGDDVEVGVRYGKVAVDGKQGKTTLRTGEYMALANSSSTYKVEALPREDSWERWNDERDRELYASEHPGYYRRGVPVYGPTSSFWFSLGIPIGPRHFWGGRGVWLHR